MKDPQQLADMKDRINAIIRYNSDRGFVHYSGCNRICGEMFAILEEAAHNPDKQQSFDIYILLLARMMKLISYADTSSGAASDVIQSCLKRIEKLCQDIDEVHKKYFFNTILKTARKKAFKEWPDDGYQLLKSAVHFVCDKKQAQKVFDIFPLLGDLHDGKPYPDKLLITFAITERLEGTEAAEKYLMEHIDVPEIRMVAVDRALTTKQYLVAEKLCREAIELGIRGHFNRRAPWAYYLEQLYNETNNQGKLTEIVRFILFHRDTAYFNKLKTIYQQQGIWQMQQELLWQELSKTLPDHEYAALLSREGETTKLLPVVQQHPSYITYYGKQLAAKFPEETHAIFEEYILEEAKASADRRKYKQVCRIIQSFAAVGAKEKALKLIECLSSTYYRRPAMLEELARIKKKLEK